MISDSELIVSTQNLEFKPVSFLWNYDVLITTGEYINRDWLKQHQIYCVQKLIDFKYAFPALEKYKNNEFIKMTTILYEMLKFFNVRRWKWCVEGCELDQLLQIYNMIE